MENLENNNQVSNTSESQIKAVDPQQNIPIPQALEERIAQQATKGNHSRARIWLLVSVVVLFVLVGVGGFWYYAQGQAWLLLRQAKWSWGDSTLENYQQDTNLSLAISTSGNSDQPAAASTLLGGKKFDIDITTQQKNIATNMEADINLKAKSDNVNFDIKLKTKKIDDKLYLFIDVGDIKDLLGGLVPVPDFGDTWLATDIKNSYNISLDKAKETKVNTKFNEFLDKLITERVFDIKDLKKDQNGFRKIQLNVKANKIDNFILSTINYGADIYEIVSEVDEVDKDSLTYKNYREENIKNFEKMKTDKPAEWEKMKTALVSIDFMILLDEDTKIIHGLELYLNNVVFDSAGVSTTVLGNIKYLIKPIEAYQIIKPTNVKEIGDWQEIFTPTLVEPNETSYFSDDVDSDQDGLSDLAESLYGTQIDNSDSDGDGYLDGQEVDNGYNPMGEGSLDKEKLIDKNYAYQQATKARNICEEDGGLWKYDFDFNTIDNIIAIDDKCYEYKDALSCQSDSNCVFNGGECFMNICQCPVGKIFDLRELSGCK
ncbi:MAG: EB domain-containing protein [Patescibacteria group bacterium]